MLYNGKGLDLSKYKSLLISPPPPPLRGRTTCVLMLFSVFTRQRSFRSRCYITSHLCAPRSLGHEYLNFYICYNILINWLRYWWVTIVTFDYIVKIKTNFKQETHIYQPTFSSGQSLSFLLLTWSWPLQSKPSDSGDENDQPTTGSTSRMRTAISPGRRSYISFQIPVLVQSGGNRDGIFQKCSTGYFLWKRSTLFRPKRCAEF